MKDNRIIKAENVYKAIENQGYYYILAEKYYGEEYIGPKYIIATDDPDFKEKKPALADMIIVPVEKFLKMAEVINESVLNDRREHFRQTYLHNAEGYYEDVTACEEEYLKPLSIEVMSMNPVGDFVESKITRERLLTAMNNLSEQSRRRLYAYYFLDKTQLEIAADENVNLFSIQKSIRSAIKK